MSPEFRTRPTIIELAEETPIAPGLEDQIMTDATQQAVVTEQLDRTSWLRTPRGKLAIGASILAASIGGAQSADRAFAEGSSSGASSTDVARAETSSGSK